MVFVVGRRCGVSVSTVARGNGWDGGRSFNVRDTRSTPRVFIIDNYHNVIISFTRVNLTCVQYNNNTIVLSIMRYDTTEHCSVMIRWCFDTTTCCDLGGRLITVTIL